MRLFDVNETAALGGRFGTGDLEKEIIPSACLLSCDLFKARIRPAEEDTQRNSEGVRNLLP
jgi:hypothetical protein